MPYKKPDELPSSVKDAIPSEEGKRMFMEVVNSQLDSGKSETVAFASAWSALNRAGYKKGDDGKYDKGYDVEKKDYKLPEGARNNAKKVLRWKEEHGDEVKGMTETGWRRARQLADNESVGAETVKAMAQFNRHRDNSKIDSEHEGEPWKDAGYVAWLGWGGDTGINWAIRQSESMEKREINEDTFTLEREASGRSMELGFDGATHVHETSDGQKVYMPGATHEEYLGQGEKVDTDNKNMLGVAVRAIIEAIMGKPKEHADIVKLDEEQRIVYGWASVVTENGQAVTDRQGDVISPDDMEKMATDFMMSARTAKAMHEGQGIGEVIHSMPMTKSIMQAFNLKSDREGWLIAMKVHDEDVWKRVKSGELKAFSIGGKAVKEDYNG